MQSVLITGAAGFVGGEVVRQLVRSGADVTGLGRNPSSDIRFVQADITDREGLNAALAGQSFDCILHLASLPGDTGDTWEMMQVNVVGCENMLGFARSSGVQRFVLASSISAYGWYPATPFEAPLGLPVDEDHPCRPKDMYSVSKRMQEMLAMAYWHQYGLPTTALRLTAVVGPRGKGGGRSWHDFAIMLAEGSRVDIPFLSDNELCHFVDLRDTARMLIVAAEEPGAVGEIFNCCGPSPTRGREFAALIGEACPDIRVEYGFPWSMAQGGELSFDMSKAERMFGFTPRHSVAESLHSILGWIGEGGLETRSERGNAGNAGAPSR